MYIIRTGKNNNCKVSLKEEVTEIEKKQRFYFGRNDSCSFNICHTSWNYDTFIELNIGISRTESNRVDSCRFGPDENRSIRKTGRSNETGKKVGWILYKLYSGQR